MNYNNIFLKPDLHIRASGEARREANTDVVGSLVIRLGARLAIRDALPGSARECQTQYLHVHWLIGFSFLKPTNS